MDDLVLSPPILFVSDAHLGGFSESENARIETELVQLINYCQRNTIQIALLGDLFDYWMEYPSHVPMLGRELLDRFEDYNRTLGPTLYITGNHDNWTRGHLSDRGFHVVSEFVELVLDGKKVMLLHGDGLADASHELKRPFIHRLLRHTGFIKLYQGLLPPSAGLMVMKYVSKTNRRLNSQDNSAKLTGWARGRLQNSELDLIISGHDHIPRKKQFSFGSYINSGTFFKHRSMVFYNNSSAELVCWKPGMQTLQSFDSTDTR